jgi:hypothetical protein
LREAEAFLAEGVGPSAGEGLERRGSDVQGVGGYEKGLLWQSAIALHQNFYENWLPPEMVEKNVEDVKKFVNKLRRSTCRWTRAIAGRLSADGSSSSFTFGDFQAPHHLPLDGLPKPAHRSSSPLVA